MSADEAVTVTMPATAKDPIGALKKRILENRHSVAKAQIDMIADIERIRATMSDEDLRSFLVVECGIPKVDIPAILDFNEVLGDHVQLLRDRATSFPVVKAMIAANSVTRKAALDSLAAGDNVDAATIRALRRIATRNSIGEHAYAERSRQRALRSAANAKTAHLVNTLGEATVTLLDKIDAFVQDYEPEPSFDPDDHVVYSPEHAVEIKAIAELAKSVFRQFQGLYGEIFVPKAGLSAMKPGTNLYRLAAVQESLKRFARGRFGYGEESWGFGLEQGKLWHRELQSSLEFLLPCATEPQPIPQSQANGTQPLRFLEICAGAGGQAIGLLKAGFQPVSLYDMNKNATATLRKNWNWPVRKTRIEKVEDIELRQHQGIDLLAGGVECRAFSGAGKQRGEKDERNLFDEAVRYVDIIRPRAFFFENVEGFNEDKFIRYRATVFQRLEALGYDLCFPEMNSKDFGVPQSRPRVVLVGVRSDQPGMFKTPESRHRVTMADALADVLFPHRGKGDSTYDAWAENWLKTHGSKRSYTVVSQLYNAHPDIRERWKTERGLEIDQGRLAEPPAGLGQVTDMTAVPFLTIEAAQVLQGFPKGWKFEGGPRQQLYQIGNAFPPQMSEAVGHAIVRALTGLMPNSVDMPPLAPFDETLIGYKAPIDRVPRLRLNRMTPDDVAALKLSYGKKFKDTKKFNAEIKKQDKEIAIEMKAYLAIRNGEPTASEEAT